MRHAQIFGVLLPALTISNPAVGPREGAVSSHHCDAEPLPGRQHSGAIQPWTPAETTHNHSNRPWHSPQTGVPALVYDSNMTKCGDTEGPWRH